KSHTIPFFLVPSLRTRALIAEVPFSALRAHIGWWLDLYRWEFPLPERDAPAAEIGRWRAYCREVGALVGDGAALDHPVIHATAGILENFREAYLVAARALAAQEEWPIAQSALAQRMRRQFQTSLLLGEVHKPEGNSMITFGNALSRLAELGHVAIVGRGPASSEDAGRSAPTRARSRAGRPPRGRLDRRRGGGVPRPRAGGLPRGRTR